MFDIGWGELMLIGIVALIAIGPKELPGALRTLGQWMAKIRRMASEFQGQFQEAMREAELAELRKDVDEMVDQATKYAHFDPVEDIRKDLEKAADLPNLEGTVTPDAPASAAAAETTLPPPVASEPDAPVAVETTPTAEPAEGTPKPDAGKAA
jgi:sec-independent protein translocase protein TatB